MMRTRTIFQRRGVHQGSGRPALRPVIVCAVLVLLASAVAGQSAVAEHSGT